MKIFATDIVEADVRRQHSRSAFTLTEVMITAGLFSIVIVGSILAHITGLKLCATA